jgi:hypothetical protein
MSGLRLTILECLTGSTTPHLRRQWNMQRLHPQRQRVHQISVCCRVSGPPRILHPDRQSFQHRSNSRQQSSCETPLPQTSPLIDLPEVILKEQNMW